MENYIKAVYELGEGAGRVTTNGLAARLGVSAPSTSAMLKRLGEMDPPLVDYAPHRGASLTEDGRRVALGVVRRHRLLELFLCEVLGFSWDEVHEEAKRLEHHLSPAVERRIAELLQHPKLDPHGDPIPSEDGAMPEQDGVPLSQVDAGQTAEVLRVSQEQPTLLRYLGEQGVRPGAMVTLTKREPFEGPLFLQAQSSTEPFAVAAEVGRLVYVRPLEPQEEQ